MLIERRPSYNAFNVYCRELAPGTVSLTGDRAQGDDSKHRAYSNSSALLKNKYRHENVMIINLYIVSHILYDRHL